MAETIIRKKTYILVWAALICLTGLTAGLSFIDLHRWSTVVAFVIALIKSGLVVAFFMHLYYERQKTVWIWAGVGVFWLCILLVLTMNDYVTRGFIRVPGR